MPFYEYECSACRHYVEVLQKISDAPLRDCPNCGKPELAKLVSAPVFRLKGSGWYETDFKSDGENKRNLADSEARSASPAAAASDSGSSGKADSTAAAAPAAKPAEAAPKPAASTPAAAPAAPKV